MKAFQRTQRTRRLGLGAACIAGLAAGSAQASIVSSGILNQVVDASHNYIFDINGDSSGDFGFTVENSNVYVFATAGYVIPGTGNNPSGLAADTLIDFTDTFRTGKNSGSLATGWPSPYPNTAFMGISFILSGATRYGWIGITANASDSAVIEQWAYEDTADTGIRAGDTGSVPVPGSALLLLSGLAVGAARTRRSG